MILNLFVEKSLFVREQKRGR